MATSSVMSHRISSLSSLCHAPFARTSLQLQTRLICAHQRRDARKRITPPPVPPHADMVGHATSFAPFARTLKQCQQHRMTISNLTRSSETPSANPICLQQTAASSQAYRAPTTGLLSYLPPSWIPYAELIRLDKPAGTYYLFLPCLFSTLLAAPLATPIALPSTVISSSALFLLGALIMRGAGCTINDLWDRNLDPHVERTRLRPIARGAITVRQAIPFLGAQLLTGLAVLVSLPTQCLWYGIPSLLLVITYPLAKRVTNYPQFVLGLAFSWGAMMGFPALGIDLLSPENTAALLSAVCLYASCVAWTIVYDMIYAYQDIRDDAVAGIKSIALAQQSRAKAFLASVAAVQVVLLASAGVAAGAGPAFFAGSCGSAAMTLGYMIKTVDLESVKDCGRWFTRGAWFTGGAITLGLASEYGMKYISSEEEDLAAVTDAT